MYYTHPKFSIERQTLKKIIALFESYDLANLNRISPKDARHVLKTIGIDPNHAQDIVENADPQQKGSVRRDNFLESLRLHWVSFL